MQAALRAWFVKHHGEGEPHQYDFYRCDLCRRLVTWNIIRSGGCGCAGGTKMRPANPTLWETFRLMALPWTVR